MTLLGYLKNLASSRADEGSRDEGDFIVQYPPKTDLAIVDGLTESVRTAIGLCRSAGIPIKDKLRIEMRPVGSRSTTLADYSPGSNPPTMASGVT